MIAVIVLDLHDECILILRGLNKPGPFAPWGFRAAGADFMRQRSHKSFTPPRAISKSKQERLERQEHWKYPESTIHS